MPKNHVTSDSLYRLCHSGLLTLKEHTGDVVAGEVPVDGPLQFRAADLLRDPGHFPGVTRVTLYRYVDPEGELREHGRRVFQS